MSAWSSVLGSPTPHLLLAGLRYPKPSVTRGTRHACELHSLTKIKGKASLLASNSLWRDMNVVCVPLKTGNTDWTEPGDRCQATRPIGPGGVPSISLARKNGTCGAGTSWRSTRRARSAKPSSRSWTCTSCRPRPPTAAAAESFDNPVRDETEAET